MAFGQVLARSLSTGPILPAVLEETAALSAQTILLNCVIRMLLAGILAGSCEFLLKVYFQATSVVKIILSLCSILLFHHSMTFSDWTFTRAQMREK